MPFAEGALTCGTPARVVDENGTPLPTQTTPLATWKPDRRHVRWLLVDFQADLPAGSQRTVFLETGPEAVPPAHATPVRIENLPGTEPSGKGVQRIDTGPLRLDIRTQAGQPLEAEPLLQCHIHAGADMWHTFLPGRPGLFCYMRRPGGERYTSLPEAAQPRVVIEEAGPLRAVIRVQGWHASETGVRFCPFLLRLHLFAGKPDLRVFHTFIFDQDPHEVELSTVGVRVPLALGDHRRAAVGGDDAAHGTTDGRVLQFVQTDDRSYSVMRDGVPFGTGTRTRAWAGLEGKLGTALAVVRNAWQDYPTGLRIDRDGLDIQVWPESTAPLNFTTPYEEQAAYFAGTRDEETFKRVLAEHPTAPLNLKSLNAQTEDELAWVERMLEKHAPTRTASYNDTGTDNGIGAAKTTEFWLRLQAGAIGDEEAEGLAVAVQEPLVAPPDPAYACATGAMGHFHHAGQPAFADVDKGLDDLLSAVAVEPIETCRLYGKMRYGNMVCSHSAAPSIAYVLHKETAPEKALRYVGPYNNEANDQIMGVWGNFLRTGRRDHFLLAQAYSRNVADVGICHAHPEPRHVGLMHYHNAHQWTGGKSPSHTLVAGLLTDYYTTGNRRLFDVAREVADWAVTHQERCGIVSCRNARLHREFTGPLWCLIDVYRATWEAGYGDVARRSLNWLLRVLPETADYPVDIFTRGEDGDEAFVSGSWAPSQCARDVYHLYEGGRHIADSQALRQRIITEADFYVWNELTDNYVTADMARRELTPRSLLWAVDDMWYWTSWGNGAGWNAAMVCLAYDLTGNPIYAAYARDHLMGTFCRLAERARHFADWRFT